ncbi:hypothetical protein B7463_g7929, partial [Scytalidium lignicola]
MLKRWWGGEARSLSDRYYGLELEHEWCMSKGNLRRGAGVAGHVGGLNNGPGGLPSYAPSLRCNHSGTILYVPCPVRSPSLLIAKLLETAQDGTGTVQYSTGLWMLYGDLLGWVVASAWHGTVLSLRSSSKQCSPGASLLIRLMIACTRCDLAVLWTSFSSGVFGGDATNSDGQMTGPGDAASLSSGSIREH